MWWIIGTVIFVVLYFIFYYAFARMQEIKEEEFKRREKLKEWDDSDYIEKVKSGEIDFNEKLEITGYSFVEFELIKSPSLCEESEELLENIKVGDFLTCMICPYREKRNEIYVNVGWFEVGVVELSYRDIIFDKVCKGNYMYCQCSRIEERNGVKHYYCKYVYYDDKGTFNIYNGMISSMSSATLASENMDKENLNMDYLTWIMPTGQLVSNLRDDYFKRFGSEAEDVLEEDNSLLIQFVKDYLGGYINSNAEKSDFIRNCTSMRMYGDSSILKKRIKLYIKDSGIEFIY